MPDDRADFVATELNNTEKWYTHGCGISIHVLRKDLKLLINDFSDDKKFDGIIRRYYNLLDDYMLRRGSKCVVHTDGLYQPFKQEIL